MGTMQYKQTQSHLSEKGLIPATLIHIIIFTLLLCHLLLFNLCNKY